MSMFSLDMDAETEKKALTTLQNYITLKAFDIISGAQYKRYVVQNKENCEQWAMTLYKDYQLVQQSIRDIPHLTQLLRTRGKHRLVYVCKLVSTYNVCPNSFCKVWSTCYVTGVRCKDALQLKVQHDVTTNDGKKNRDKNSHEPARVETIEVHRKFWRFIVSYWVLCRFEFILKSLLRHWMHNVDADNEMKTTDVCNLFSQDTVFMKTLQDLFQVSWMHVFRSVSKLSVETLI
jgi:hypothetical protein